MKQRIITGILLSIFALSLIYFGGAVLGIATMMCLSFVLSEVFRALTEAGHRPVAWPTWTALISTVPLALHVGNAVFIPILLTSSVLIIVCVLFRSEPKLEDALMSLLPLYAVVLPGLSIVSLALVEPLSVQRTLIGLLICVPVVGDTFAYFCGSRIGGPKFCPAVSPNKTIAGAVAGLVGSLLVAALIRLVAGLICAPTTVLPSWIACIALGLIGGAASQVGDLFSSLIKRHCGIKDYSNMFPGHGGMYDRLDSILFNALVLFSFRVIWFP